MTRYVVEHAMRAILFLIAFSCGPTYQQPSAFVPPPDPAPRYACQSPCSSNNECRSTRSNDCVTCYFGRCSTQTLPTPTP